MKIETLPKFLRHKIYRYLCLAKIKAKKALNQEYHKFFKPVTFLWLKHGEGVAYVDPDQPFQSPLSFLNNRELNGDWNVSDDQISFIRHFKKSGIFAFVISENRCLLLPPKYIYSNGTI